MILKEVFALIGKFSAVFSILVVVIYVILGMVMRMVYTESEATPDRLFIFVSSGLAFVIVTIFFVVSKNKKEGTGND